MDKKTELNNVWNQAQKCELSVWTGTNIDHASLVNDWYRRIKQIGLNINDLDKMANILDVGCGPVPLLYILPRTNLMVAADPLNDGYKNKFMRKEHIIYETFMAEKIPYEDEKFSIIFCINALDHMKDPQRAIAEMMRVLKSDGLLYLEFENTSPLSKFLVWLGYTKPLSEFHPHIISTSGVLKMFSASKFNFNIRMIEGRPQFSFSRIKYLFELILKKRVMTEVEKSVSTLSYGKHKFIFHHIIIFTELILYFFFKKDFSYFVNIIIQKNDL